MNKTTIHILPLFFLLIFSTGCANALNTMKIPLAEGYENPPIQIDNTTVEVACFDIQENPYSDSFGTLFTVELNISENERQYSTSLHYFLGTDGHNENYPTAFGKHLFGLEINDTETKPQAALTIEQNDFGQPFFIDLKQEAVIGSLTVRFDNAINEWSQYDPDEPAFCDTEVWFTLSENNEQMTFSFMAAHDLQAKGSLLFDWEDYQICVLDCFETIMLLKIDKKPIEKPDFGQPFSLELNQETVIGGLTVRFNDYWFKWKISDFPDGTTEREVSIGQIELSENGEEETIIFDSDDMNEKGELIFGWKDYSIQILSIPEREYLFTQLKIEKK